MGMDVLGINISAFETLTRLIHPDILTDREYIQRFVFKHFDALIFEFKHMDTLKTVFIKVTDRCVYIYNPCKILYSADRGFQSFDEAKERDAIYQNMMALFVEIGRSVEE